MTMDAETLRRLITRYEARLAILLLDPYKVTPGLRWVLNDLQQELEKAQR